MEIQTTFNTNESCKMDARNNPIELVFEKQKQFFQEQNTIDLAFRRQALKKLYAAIKQNEALLVDALYKDLGRSPAQAFATEIGTVLSEITYFLKNLKRLTKAKRQKQTLLTGLASAKIYAQPKGQILVISPWNYPVNLVLSPLVGAIASGNTVMIKPSEVSPNSSKAIYTLLSSIFEEAFVCVCEGGVELTQQLLELEWDHIFFTGSTKVGKIIAEKAAKHLTPITLELGGKSPTIVCQSANLKVAARRIVFGKFLNAGQTCIAPDYLLVDEAIADKFTDILIHEITQRLGEDAKTNPDYGRIINYQHTQRLTSYLQFDPSKICHGGDFDLEDKYIAPTLLTGIDDDHPIMHEEIFGPILPIIRYRSLGEAITELKRKPKPLALYLFTENKSEKLEIINHLSFGGGCINDTLMHITHHELPFGGIGSSGMGAYHGEHSFSTFSHFKSIVDTPALFDPPVRYMPFSKWKETVFRLLFR